MELNGENYFSEGMQQKYFSVSQYKAFLSCQAAAIAALSGEYQKEKTEALLVGSYVDAYFEGALPRFQQENPEIFKGDGALREPYKKADGIIRRIERDPFFLSFLDGAKQVVMTGEVSGVPVKIKVDALHPDKIVDLKIVRDFAFCYAPGKGRMHFIEYWGYDLQGAVYQEIVRQNTGKTLPFYIAAATKEKEPDIGVFQVPQHLLDFELQEFAGNLPYFEAVKNGVFPPERCERCDYCKHTKVLERVVDMEDMEDE